jgi:hypothetical protein
VCSSKCLPNGGRTCVCVECSSAQATYEVRTCTMTCVLLSKRSNWLRAGAGVVVPNADLRSLRLWCTRDATVFTWLSAPLAS